MIDNNEALRQLTIWVRSYDKNVAIHGDNQSDFGYSVDVEFSNLRAAVGCMDIVATHDEMSEELGMSRWSSVLLPLGKSEMTLADTVLVSFTLVS